MEGEPRRPRAAVDSLENSTAQELTKLTQTSQFSPLDSRDKKPFAGESPWLRGAERLERPIRARYTGLCHQRSPADTRVGGVQRRGTDDVYALDSMVHNSVSLYQVDVYSVNASSLSH
jgi:hypothetical protein